jgi:hypothetical protein
VQEHHDLAHNLLLGPCSDNPLGPYRPNAVDLSEAIGLGLDDIEDLLGNAIGVLTVATFTGGGSGDSLSDELVIAASKIDFGSSKPAVPLASPSGLTTPTLLIPALPIAIGCDPSVGSNSAVRNGAER